MGSARVGELKRAAQRLGVTSTTLRQQGWKTASPERIEAAEDDPPDWLVVARERRRVKRARQERLRDRKNTAARLEVQARAVRERDITPSEVEDLLAAPPDWLIAEQARQTAQTEREAKDRIRRELTDVLVMSVHDAWFQQLKRATSDAEVDAIDARWAPEVDRVRREAQQMVDELTPGQAPGFIRWGERIAVSYRSGFVRRRKLSDPAGRMSTSEHAVCRESGRGGSVSRNRKRPKGAPTHVRSVALRLTPAQRRLVDTRFHAGVRVYNACLREALDRGERMRADPGFACARAMAPGVDRTAAFHAVRDTHGFTSFALRTYASGLRCSWVRGRRCRRRCRFSVPGHSKRSTAGTADPVGDPGSNPSAGV